MGNSTNARGPCPCNLKKIAWRLFALFTLLPAAVHFTGACRRASDGLVFPPPAEIQVRLDYNRADLIGSNTAAPAVSGLLPASAHLDALPVLVKIQSPELGTLPGPATSRTCLISQAAFYFQREQGLRFSYCAPLDKENEARELLREAGERRRAGPSLDVRPEVHAGELVLAIAGMARIKEKTRSFGSLLMSVEGGPESERFVKAGLRGTSGHFETGPRIAEGLPGAPGLGRVFPGTGFHLLLYEEHIVLLYELNAREYLFVSARVNMPNAPGAAHRLRATHERLLESARLESPAVTEIYFGNQGPRSAAYIELGAIGAENTRARLRLRGREETEVDVFLFAHATVLLPGSLPDLRDVLTIEGPRADAREYRLEDYRADGAAAGRALTMSAGETHRLRPARFTRGGEILGNKGLHPYFARFENIQAKGPACTAHDFHLTEWNPFGLRDAAGRALTGGKFLELRMARACRNESVLIFAEAIVLDPGARDFHADERVLFVADDAFFEKRDALKISALRGLRSDARIRIVNLADESEIRVRVPPAGASYIFGAPHSPFLRRVHSLVRGESGDDLFHGTGGRGLRPDLAPYHAMSPGFAHAGETPRPAGLEIDTSLRLSEILPRGSLNAEGKSIAGDEFLEIDFAGFSGRFAEALNLRVTPAAGNERLYIFPPPRGGTARNYLVFARGELSCFRVNQGALVPVRSFSLPNGAARYTLTRGSHIAPDRIYLDNALQAQLDSAQRVSYARVAEHVWFPTADPRAASPNCPSTLATPGNINPE